MTAAASHRLQLGHRSRLQLQALCRQSADNGETWGASDFAVSTSIIPQPQQTDGGVQSCYAGDYDYSTAQGSNAYVTWTDGRRNVGGVQVQDVNLAVVPEQ